MGAYLIDDFSIAEAIPHLVPETMPHLVPETMPHLVPEKEPESCDRKFEAPKTTNVSNEETGAHIVTEN